MGECIHTTKLQITIMKTLLIICLITILLLIGCEEEQGISGILPDSFGLGMMFINLETRGGDIKGAAPMAFGIWNRNK